ncbi:MAG: type II secretion system secretin GspD [Gammaproteobacteria bacterium]|nr:type II secretion system secretin GspD [Gammaproteobacteria bacterium]
MTLNNIGQTATWKKWILHSASVCLLVGLVGCAGASPKWRSVGDMPDDGFSAGSAPAGDPEISPGVRQPGSIAEHATATNPQIFIGKDLRVSPERNDFTETTPGTSSGGDIVLNFVDTPVRDAVQIILGDHLGIAYSVAPEVQGLVNLNNQAGLRREDLIPTLEALLRGVDAGMLKDGAGYRIVAGAGEQIFLGAGNLEIIPLRYIDAAEFAKILGDYQVRATVIEGGNLLALSGTGEKINQVRELARSFDINWLQGMSIGIFPVANASALSIRNELMEMFGNGIDNEVAGALRIVAVERSNSIMVISAQRDYLKMMGDWIGRLDRIGDDAGQKFFIYRVQNGRAADLAELLRQMFGASRPDAERDASDVIESETLATATENFRVTADESTNSLIVSGSPHYYKFVKQAMEQLDSTPLQVLVEARIMELTLTDELKYGLEWFLRGSRSNSETSARLDLGSTGIGLTAPGFSYVIERAGEVRAALNGLADDSRLKVLSSPSLMVLNNQTASILVGDEVPIPIRQATSNISPDAPTVNEIEYRNTGILLTVSPRVNSGGMVTMDISQEVSSVVQNTSSQIDAPTIQQRQLNSTVSIRSGQTVVLGGLIKEQDSGSESGVPFLKDIPGLGKLFSSTSNTVQRTELVVLITPRVILGGQDTLAITEEYRRKMIGLRPIPLREL